MLNLKMIYKVIGSLLFIETALLLSCIAVSFFYQETDYVAFLIASFITFLVGFTLRLMGRKADNNMGRKDAYLVVTLSWILFSAFGALPFLFTGSLSSFTDGFFETMSGFTTTGASIIDNVEGLSHGLLFWRSMTHWIGGLGIVFFTIGIVFFTILFNF